MAYIQRHTVAITTDGSGDATSYSSAITGRIVAIQYIKASSANFTDGVDFTITAEATGETLWTEANVNATKYCYPRAATHSTAGVAATYDGTRAVFDIPALANDRVKIVVAQGGAAKTGTFHIVVE